MSGAYIQVALKFWCLKNGDFIDSLATIDRSLSTGEGAEIAEPANPIRAASAALPGVLWNYPELFPWLPIKIPYPRLMIGG